MIRIAGLFLAATLVLAGANFARADDYVPAPETLSRLSVEQALAVVNSAPNRPNAIRLPGESLVLITGVKFGLSRITVADDQGRTTELPLANAKIEVNMGGFFDPHGITINGNFLVYSNLGDQQFRSVAEATYVLRNTATSGAAPGGDAAFAQVVASYRAAQPKPQIPEDVRRFEVQAEGAVNDKDFSGAAAYYGRALTIAPWWPGGHYNRALVLAEIGEYETAMAEMQRYLLLTPDAPDARAGQDKIYEWERRMNSQSLSPSAPLPKPIPAEK